MAKESLNFGSLQRSKRDLWLLRAVAMVISVLLCLTVLGGKRVEVIKKVFLEYQLKKGLVVANQAPSDVTVKVLGPRAFMREFQERISTLNIDLSKMGPGDYEVNIRDDMLEIPLGLKVLSISQTSIPVRVDYLSTKRLPIRAVFGSQLPEDIKVKNITFKPSTVEIQGSRQRLVSIDVIPTEPIKLSSENFKQELEVKLSTSDLPGISLKDSERLVQAVVELEGELSRRWFVHVPIGIKTGTGGVAKKLDADSGIRLRPAVTSFLLEGVPKRIEKLKDADIEAWVEIPEMKTGTQRLRLLWSLPPDVRIVKRNTDWVEVQVSSQYQNSQGKTE